MGLSPGSQSHLFRGPEAHLPNPATAPHPPGQQAQCPACPSPPKASCSHASSRNTVHRPTPPSLLLRALSGLPVAPASSQAPNTPTLALSLCPHSAPFLPGMMPSASLSLAGPTPRDSCRAWNLHRLHPLYSFNHPPTHPPSTHHPSLHPPVKGAPSCAPGDWSLCPCGWVSQRGSRGRERRYRSNRGSGQALGRVLLRLRLHRARQDTSQAEGPAAGPQGWKSRAVGTEDSGSDVWGRQTLAHSGAEQSGQPLAESK